jgi:hypothetical protein
LRCDHGTAGIAGCEDLARGHDLGQFGLHIQFLLKLGHLAIAGRFGWGLAAGFMGPLVILLCSPHLVTNRKTAVNLAEYFVIQVVLLQNLLQTYIHTYVSYYFVYVLTLLLFNGVHCGWGHLLDRSRPGKRPRVPRVIVVLYCHALRAMETVRVLPPPIFNFVGIKAFETISKICHAT